jgi:hypothetical protein
MAVQLSAISTNKAPQCTLKNQEHRFKHALPNKSFDEELWRELFQQYLYL